MSTSGEAGDLNSGETHTGEALAGEAIAGEAIAGEAIAGEAIAGEVGVGPWVGPWPEDPRYDADLLAHGDRRNVVDRYRYWSNEAIVADLDRHRHPFHVAIENFQHDRNIGTVVRTANAFGAAGVHIVGKRRWNRRGAMVTDRYVHLHHHPDVASLVSWATAAGLPLVGVDILPGAEAIERAQLPEACVLVFGQEGPGLSAETTAACDRVLAIAQYGSTRSINAGVAAGIAMHTWVRQHAGPPPAPEASATTTDLGGRMSAQRAPAFRSPGVGEPPPSPR